MKAIIDKLKSMEPEVTESAVMVRFNGMYGCVAYIDEAGKTVTTSFGEDVLAEAQPKRTRKPAPKKPVATESEVESV